MLSTFQNNTFRFSLVLDLVNKPLSSPKVFVLKQMLIMVLNTVSQEPVTLWMSHRKLQLPDLKKKQKKKPYLVIKLHYQKLA